MSLAIALDLLVAVLLVATIAYAFMLNRRLGQLRGGNEQMQQLIGDFYQATTHAEASLSALKDAVGKSDSELTGQLDSLIKVRDELEFLVARAEAESARLDELIRGGRMPAKASPAPVAENAGLDAELFGSDSPRIQQSAM